MASYNLGIKAGIDGWTADGKIRLTGADDPGSRVEHEGGKHGD